MKLDDMQNLIGQKVYTLRVGQVNTIGGASFVYRIYPVELTVQEIRLGKAGRETDEEYYGPGFTTLLCQHAKGYVQAFSPVGNEIISKSTIAGRNTRAFLSKGELYQEAQILKECVLKNYNHVGQVAIDLPEKDAGLEERLQDAFVRATESVSSDEIMQKEMSL